MQPKDDKARLKEEKKLQKEREKEEKRLRKEQEKLERENERKAQKISKFTLGGLKEKPERRRSVSLGTPDRADGGFGDRTARGMSPSQPPKIDLSDDEINTMFEQMLTAIGANDEVKKTSRTNTIQAKYAMVMNWKRTESQVSTSDADEEVKNLLKKVSVRRCKNCCRSPFSKKSFRKQTRSMC